MTGGLELSRTTGAEYVVPAGDDIGYPARRITDGEVVDGGTFTLRAIHTPGHTREHISYVLEDASGDVGRRVHRRFDALRQHRAHRPSRGGKHP